MLKYIVSFVLFFCLDFIVQGQRATFLSRSELGLMVGGTYYFGDLNRFNQFNNTKLAGGLLYRFNIHSRLALRGNLLYGTVKGDDSQSKIDLNKNRNLNFTSSIFELAGGIEFNYFPFEVGHKRHKGTAYILTEIGLFHMNPVTRYNGEDVALQPLGTEGQGSSLSKRNNYSLTQLCIPLGVGARMSLGGWMTLNLEVGLRKTFTDYIDDVHQDTYVDPIALADINNEHSDVIALSNRSLDGSKYGKRGTASTNDWYVFSGFMITFKLGKKSICHFFG